nr:reductase RED1 [Bipolaris maydis]
MYQNKSLIFKNPPIGWPKPDVDFGVECRPIDINGDIPLGGVILKNCYVSLDPYQRGRMRAPTVDSYSPPFTIGDPMEGHVISRVIRSASTKLQPGDFVSGVGPIQEFSVLSAGVVDGFTRIENPYNLNLEIFLGPLGMPGLTAYSSFYEIGKPKKGETIFISAASCAVGQLVGQLAKREGLYVIGSVGDDEKVEFITKGLGFDVGFNYKKEVIGEALMRVAPEGIDIYFDNVGGQTLESALYAMRPRGRIVVSGMISQYNLQPSELYGVKNLFMVITNRITIQGFIVTDSDMGPKYSAEHLKNVSQWIYDGSLKPKIHVDTGMDHACQSFINMLKGRKIGKAVLQIADLNGD